MSSKTWEVMNDLEMVTSKIVSAREIIDSVAEAIQKNDYNKAETLAMASYEFLGYYLEEFDKKFKLAWEETVVKSKKEDPCMPPWGHSDLEYLSKYKKPLSCDKDDPSPECQGAWNSFWEESNNSHSKYYYEYDRNDSNRKNPFVDKVKKWVLPVEEVKIDETDETEYFISFPDDLLEATNLKEGDQVEWVDQGDGSYLLRKVTQPLGMSEC
jgi:hypothetical protein